MAVQDMLRRRRKRAAARRPDTPVNRRTKERGKQRGVVGSVKSTAQKVANSVTGRSTPSNPVNPRSSKGQQQRFNSSQVSGDRDRDERFAATPETTIDPNRGIRPGQFGEIDEKGTRSQERIIIPGQPDISQEEAMELFKQGEGFVTTEFIDEGAGERVVFDDQGRATVQDSQGNVLREAGDVETPQERTLQTRRQADAPLQSPEAGARGQAGDLGFSPRAIGGRGRELQIQRDIARIDEELQGGRITGGGINETPADVQQRKAALQQRKTSLIEEQRQLQQQQEEEQEAQITPGTEGITPDTQGLSRMDFSISNEGGQQNNAQIQTLLSEVNQNPALSPYAGVLQGLLTRQNSSNAQARFMSQMLQFQAEDLDRSGVSDGVEDAAEASRALIQQRTERLDAINEENKQIALEAARVKKEMAELSQAEIELQQKAREQEQIEANIENEIKNRRLANRLGIESGTNGLKFLRDEVRKGRDALNRLQEFGDIQEAKFALQTGSQYSLDVRQALNNYESNQATIDANFSSQLAEVNNMVSADAKERKSMRSKIYKEYWDAKDKEDERAAENMKKAADIMTDAIQDFQKNNQAETIKTGDSIKFIGDITKEINKNKFIADARNVDTRFRAITSQIERIEAAEAAGDTEAKNFADQALINLFNKITDPGSVVRESEFARSAQGLSLVQRANAIIKKVTEGGVLEPQARIELQEAARTLRNEYANQLERDLQPYIARIDMFNSQPGVQTPVELKDVIPSNLVPQI